MQAYEILYYDMRLNHVKFNCDKKIVGWMKEVNKIFFLASIAGNWLAGPIIFIQFTITLQFYQFCTYSEH